MNFEVRDHRNPGWLWADRDIIKKDGATLGPYGIAVYVALCSFAGMDQTAWPSLSTLAKTIGCSRRKVVEVVHTLEEMGWIRVENRTHENGDPDSNVYHLLGSPHKRQDQGVVHPMHQGSAPGAPEVKPLNDIPESRLDSGASFACPECGQLCKSKGGLTNHRRKAHDVDERHPAVASYQDKTHIRPNQVVRQRIAAVVGDHPANIHVWDSVIEGWLLSGWRPNNAGGMLEFYERNQIPGTKGGNGHGRNTQHRGNGGQVGGKTLTDWERQFQDHVARITQG